MPGAVNAPQGEPSDSESREHLHRRFLSHVLSHVLSIRPFSGILRDIKARAPYYVSDWVDAWNYRVVPATALTFFSKYVCRVVL